MTENNDEIKSQSANSLNFVKVVDPNQKNDKRDQNDIVEKKRNGSRNIEAATSDRLGDSEELGEVRREEQEERDHPQPGL